MLVNVAYLLESQTVNLKEFHIISGGLFNFLFFPVLPHQNTN